MFDGLSFALVCLVCYSRCVGAPLGQDGRWSSETRGRGSLGRAVGADDGWRRRRAGRAARALVTEYLVRASRVAELSRFGARSSRVRRGRCRSCATVRRLRRWYFVRAPAIERAGGVEARGEDEGRAREEAAGTGS